MQPLEVSTSQPPAMKERISLMIGSIRPSERDGEGFRPSDSMSRANELLDELEVTNMKKEMGV